jgi:hypothetical protein
VKSKKTEVQIQKKLKKMLKNTHFAIQTIWKQKLVLPKKAQTPAKTNLTHIGITHLLVIFETTGDRLRLIFLD